MCGIVLRLALLHPRLPRIELRALLGGENRTNFRLLLLAQRSYRRALVGTNASERGASRGRIAGLASRACRFHVRARALSQLLELDTVLRVDVLDLLVLRVREVEIAHHAVLAALGLASLSLRCRVLRACYGCGANQHCDRCGRYTNPIHPASKYNLRMDPSRCVGSHSWTGAVGRR